MQHLQHQPGLATGASRLATLAASALLFTLSLAHANDTTATLGAGGLELTVSPDIVMEKEDLYLSPKEVRVSYQFRNTSAKDITARVAFPMPDVPFGPMDNYILPQAETDNFVGFTVTSDGQPIEPELYMRAISAPLDDDIIAPGTDVTEAVRSAGLPVNAGSENWLHALLALPHGKRQALVAQGLLYDDQGDASPEGLLPQWLMRGTYHWEQLFPAGKPVRLEHRYMPVAGLAYFPGNVSDIDALTTDDRYCIDRNTRAGIVRLLERAREASAGREHEVYVYASEIEYILHTGANWKGPIGGFRMTLDKLHPDAVLSTCAKGLVKTGPTTFTVERRNFTPVEDIRFVVFHLGEPA